MFYVSGLPFHGLAFLCLDFPSRVRFSLMLPGWLSIVLALVFDVLFSLRIDV